MLGLCEAGGEAVAFLHGNSSSLAGGHLGASTLREVQVLTGWGGEARGTRWQLPLVFWDWSHVGWVSRMRRLGQGNVGISSSTQARADERQTLADLGREDSVVTPRQL